MKSILKFAVASLALSGLASVVTPVIAAPGHMELRVDNGYYAAPLYAPPHVIYEAPMPIYRYRDDRAWRVQEWRERQRHEYWRERNEWRAQQWREHHAHDRWDDRRDFNQDQYGNRR